MARKAEVQTASAAKAGGHSEPRTDVEIEDRSSTKDLASAPAALVLKQTTVFASMAGNSVSATEALKGVIAGKSLASVLEGSNHARDSDGGQAEGVKCKWVDGEDAKLITVMETIVEENYS